MSSNRATTATFGQWPTAPIRLTTPSGRLILRSPLPGDAPALHANGIDPETIRHLPHLQPPPPKEGESAPPVKPLSSTERWLERVIAGHADRSGEKGPAGANFVLVIEEVESGKVLGDSGVGGIFFDKEGGTGSGDGERSLAGEVGVMLSRAAWGKGYGTEALGASLAFGFEQLGLNRIVAGTLEANEGMRAIMRKLGYGEGEQDTPTSRRWSIDRKMYEAAKAQAQARH